MDSASEEFSAANNLTANFRRFSQTKNSKAHGAKRPDLYARLFWDLQSSILYFHLF